MLVALHCLDKPGALQIRLDNREAHLAHIKSSGIAVQAGPLLDGDDQMCGSLLVFEVETLDQVEKWVENDPYNKAGLFQTVVLRPWKRVVG